MTPIGTIADGLVRAILARAEERHRALLRRIDEEGCGPVYAAIAAGLYIEETGGAPGGRPRQPDPVWHSPAWILKERRDEFC